MSGILAKKGFTAPVLGEFDKVGSGTSSAGMLNIFKKNGRGPLGLAKFRALAADPRGEALNTMLKDLRGGAQNATSTIKHLKRAMEYLDEARKSLKHDCGGGGLGPNFIANLPVIEYTRALPITFDLMGLDYMALARSPERMRRVTEQLENELAEDVSAPSTAVTVTIHDPLLDAAHERGSVMQRLSAESRNVSNWLVELFFGRTSKAVSVEADIAVTKPDQLKSKLGKPTLDDLVLGIREAVDAVRKADKAVARGKRVAVEHVRVHEPRIVETHPKQSASSAFCDDFERLHGQLSDASRFSSRTLRSIRLGANGAQQALMTPAFGANPNYLPAAPEPKHTNGATKCHLECSHVNSAASWPQKLPRAFDFL
mmetsp:Transcript_15374/g.42163  ORF Transcript_15374/g.42163 Transcript_15374/m.42163 type:complete len:371 (+) Transcript_15374:149-1261(+)